MRNDNLHFNSQEKLYAGIKKVSQAVGSTMGTGGNNAIIEAIENPGHLMTNDGFSIANSIVLADPIEEMGRKILVESINRANKASGDGSSTTCVLTAAIIEEGMKHTDEAHPMDIKRSLEDCISIIEEGISSQKREITTDTVGQVAVISSEDEDIGRMIQEIYQKIGKDGIVYWDISKTSKDSYSIGQGITVEGAGYFSPYMCDVADSGQSTNQIRIKDAYIILTKQKISSANDLNDIGAYLYANDIRDVVLFCDDIDPLVVPDIIKTRMVKGFRFAVVKMPVLWKDWWYEDLAKATGAKVVDPTLGLKMKDLHFEHLGQVGNIVITKEDTYIDGIKDVSEHIKSLETENTDDSKLRASRLNTKTARYFVGAQSDSALSYRRLKVEDAISAAYQALNGGIVAGGGTALASIKLPDTIGGKILSRALKAPASTIASNVGFKDITVGIDYDGIGGFDTRTKKFVNMFDAGIIDPANIVLNAVKNAISVAATVLTAPTLVTLPRMEQPQQPQPSIIQR
jgi:chaperonin GroEL